MAGSDDRRSRAAAKAPCSWAARSLRSTTLGSGGCRWSSRVRERSGRRMVEPIGHRPASGGLTKACWPSVDPNLSPSQTTERGRRQLRIRRRACLVRTLSGESGQPRSAATDLPAVGQLTSRCGAIRPGAVRAGGVGVVLPRQALRVASGSRARAGSRGCDCGLWPRRRRASPRSPSPARLPRCARALRAVAR